MSNTQEKKISSYTDGNGKTYHLFVDIPKAIEIKNEVGIDILEIDNQETLASLAANFYQLIDILYILTGKPCDPKEFASGLFGDHLEDAFNAFMEAVVNFFPGRRKIILKKSIEKGRQMDEKILDGIEKAIENMTLEEIQNLSGK